MSADRSFTGQVRPGRGLGSNLMADPAILRALEELAGFPVVPGTLNVMLDHPFGRPTGTFRIAAEDIAADWSARTGQLGYRLTPVLIDDRYRGLAMQAEEEGYAAEQVELICEVRLRDVLGLQDDDLLRFSVVEGAGRGDLGNIDQRPDQ